MRQVSLPFRVTAGAVATAFLFTTFCQPYVEASFWEDRRVAAKAAQGGSQGQKNSGDQMASLPSTALDQALPGIQKTNLTTPFPRQELFGSTPNISTLKGCPQWMSAMSSTGGDISRVRLSPHPDKDPLVILVQDVHEVASAQASIGQILEQVQTATAQAHQGPLLVGLEGAAGPIQLEALRLLKGADHYGEFVAHLLEEKIITGAESFGATTAVEPQMWGVETPALYHANVEAYLKSVPLKEKFITQLAALRQKLQSDLSTAPEPFRRVEQTVDLFHQGQLDPIRYVRRLAEVVPPAEQPQPVRELLALAETEGRLNFGVIERERRALVSALSQGLNKTLLEELTSASLAYKAGQISFNLYFSFLSRAVEAAGLSWAPYGSFQQYVRYVIRTEGLDKHRLFDAFDVLAKKAEAQTALTEETRAWAIAAGDLRLLERLSHHEMSPGEWASYRTRRGEIVQRTTRLGLEREGMTSGSISLAQVAEVFEGFYREAELRNQALLDNLRLRQKSLNSRVSVLVVGGFHAPELERLMTAQGISVLTMTPRVGALSSGDHALDVFTVQHIPLEKLLLGEKLYLPKPMVTGWSRETRSERLTSYIVRLVSFWAVAGKSISPEILERALRWNGVETFQRIEETQNKIRLSLTWAKAERLVITLQKVGEAWVISKLTTQTSWKGLWDRFLLQFKPLGETLMLAGLSIFSAPSVLWASGFQSVALGPSLFPMVLTIALTLAFDRRQLVEASPGRISLPTQIKEAQPQLLRLVGLALAGLAMLVLPPLGPIVLVGAASVVWVKAPQIKLLWEQMRTVRWGVPAALRSASREVSSVDWFKIFNLVLVTLVWGALIYLGAEGAVEGLGSLGVDLLQSSVPMVHPLGRLVLLAQWFVMFSGGVAFFLSGLWVWGRYFVQGFSLKPLATISPSEKGELKTPQSILQRWWVALKKGAPIHVLLSLTWHMTVDLAGALKGFAFESTQRALLILEQPAAKVEGSRFQAGPTTLSLTLSERAYHSLLLAVRGQKGSPSRDDFAQVVGLFLLPFVASVGLVGRRLKLMVLSTISQVFLMVVIGHLLMVVGPWFGLDPVMTLGLISSWSALSLVDSLLGTNGVATLAGNGELGMALVALVSPFSILNSFVLGFVMNAFAGARELQATDLGEKTVNLSGPIRAPPRWLHLLNSFFHAQRFLYPLWWLMGWVFYLPLAPFKSYAVSANQKTNIFWATLHTAFGYKRGMRGMAPVLGVLGSLHGVGVEIALLKGLAHVLPGPAEKLILMIESHEGVLGAGQQGAAALGINTGAIEVLPGFTVDDIHAIGHLGRQSTNPEQLKQIMPRVKSKASFWDLPSWLKHPSARAENAPSKSPPAPPGAETEQKIQSPATRSRPADEPIHSTSDDTPAKAWLVQAAALARSQNPEDHVRAAFAAGVALELDPNNQEAKNFFNQLTPTPSPLPEGDKGFDRAERERKDREIFSSMERLRSNPPDPLAGYLINPQTGETKTLQDPSDIIASMLKDPRQAELRMVPFPTDPVNPATGRPSVFGRKIPSGLEERLSRDGVKFFVVVKNPAQPEDESQWSIYIPPQHAADDALAQAQRDLRNSKVEMAMLQDLARAEDTPYFALLLKGANINYGLFNAGALVKINAGPHFDRIEMEDNHQKSYWKFDEKSGQWAKVNTPGEDGAPRLFIEMKGPQGEKYFQAVTFLAENKGKLFVEPGVKEPAKMVLLGVNAAAERENLGPLAQQGPSREKEQQARYQNSLELVFGQNAAQSELAKALSGVVSEQWMKNNVDRRMEMLPLRIGLQVVQTCFMLAGAAGLASAPLFQFLPSLLGLIGNGADIASIPRELSEDEIKGLLRDVAKQAGEESLADDQNLTALFEALKGDKEMQVILSRMKGTEYELIIRAILSVAQNGVGVYAALDGMHETAKLEKGGRAGSGGGGSQNDPSPNYACEVPEGGFVCVPFNPAPRGSPAKGGSGGPKMNQNDDALTDLSQNSPVSLGGTFSVLQTLKLIMPSLRQMAIPVDITADFSSFVAIFYPGLIPSDPKSATQLEAWNFNVLGLSFFSFYKEVIELKAFYQAIHSPDVYMIRIEKQSLPNSLLIPSRISAVSKAEMDKAHKSTSENGTVVNLDNPNVFYIPAQGSSEKALVEAIQNYFNAQRMRAVKSEGGVTVQRGLSPSSLISPGTGTQRTLEIEAFLRPFLGTFDPNTYLAPSGLITETRQDTVSHTFDQAGLILAGLASPEGDYIYAPLSAQAMLRIGVFDHGSFYGEAGAPPNTLQTDSARVLESDRHPGPAAELALAFMAGAQSDVNFTDYMARATRLGLFLSHSQDRASGGLRQVRDGEVSISNEEALRGYAALSKMVARLESVTPEQRRALQLKIKGNELGIENRDKSVEKILEELKKTQAGLSHYIDEQIARARTLGYLPAGQTAGHENTAFFTDVQALALLVLGPEVLSAKGLDLNAFVERVTQEAEVNFSQGGKERVGLDATNGPGREGAQRGFPVIHNEWTSDWALALLSLARYDRTQGLTEEARALEKKAQLYLQSQVSSAESTQQGPLLPHMTAPGNVSDVDATPHALADYRLPLKGGSSSAASHLTLALLGVNVYGNSQENLWQGADVAAPPIIGSPIMDPPPVAPRGEAESRLQVFMGEKPVEDWRDIVEQARRPSKNSLDQGGVRFLSSKNKGSTVWLLDTKTQHTIVVNFYGTPEMKEAYLKSRETDAAIAKDMKALGEKSGMGYVVYVEKSSKGVPSLEAQRVALGKSELQWALNELGKLSPQEQKQALARGLFPWKDPRTQAQYWIQPDYPQDAVTLESINPLSGTKETQTWDKGVLVKTIAGDIVTDIVAADRYGHPLKTLSRNVKTGEKTERERLSIRYGDANEPSQEVWKVTDSREGQRIEFYTGKPIPRVVITAQTVTVTTEHSPRTGRGAVSYVYENASGVLKADAKAGELVAVELLRGENVTLRHPRSGKSLPGLVATERLDVQTQVQELVVRDQSTGRNLWTFRQNPDGSKQVDVLRPGAEETRDTFDLPVTPQAPLKTSSLPRDDSGVLGEITIRSGHLQLRSQSGREGRVLQKLSPQETVTILEGDPFQPKSWCKIRTSDGIVGWVNTGPRKAPYLRWVETAEEESVLLADSGTILSDARPLVPLVAKTSQSSSATLPIADPFKDLPSLDKNWKLPSAATSSQSFTSEFLGVDEAGMSVSLVTQTKGETIDRTLLIGGRLAGAVVESQGKKALWKDNGETKTMAGKVFREQKLTTWEKTREGKVAFKVPDKNDRAAFNLPGDGSTWSHAEKVVHQGKPAIRVVTVSPSTQEAQVVYLSPQGVRLSQSRIAESRMGETSGYSMPNDADEVRFYKTLDSALEDLLANNQSGGLDTGLRVKTVAPGVSLLSAVDQDGNPTEAVLETFGEGAQRKGDSLFAAEPTSTQTLGIKSDGKVLIVVEGKEWEFDKLDALLEAVKNKTLPTTGKETGRTVEVKDQAVTPEGVPATLVTTTEPSGKVTQEFLSKSGELEAGTKFSPQVLARRGAIQVDGHLVYKTFSHPSSEDPTLFRNELCDPESGWPIHDIGLSAPGEGNRWSQEFQDFLKKEPLWVYAHLSQLTDDGFKQLDGGNVLITKTNRFTGRLTYEVRKNGSLLYRAGYDPDLGKEVVVEFDPFEGRYEKPLEAYEISEEGSVLGLLDAVLKKDTSLRRAATYETQPMPGGKEIQVTMTPLTFTETDSGKVPEDKARSVVKTYGTADGRLLTEERWPQTGIGADSPLEGVPVTRVEYDYAPEGRLKTAKSRNPSVKVADPKRDDLMLTTKFSNTFDPNKGGLLVTQIPPEGIPPSTAYKDLSGNIVYSETEQKMAEGNSKTWKTSSDYLENILMEIRTAIEENGKTRSAHKAQIVHDKNPAEFGVPEAVFKKAGMDPSTLLSGGSVVFFDLQTGQLPINSVREYRRNGDPRDSPAIVDVGHGTYFVVTKWNGTEPAETVLMAANGHVHETLTTVKTFLEGGKLYLLVRAHPADALGDESDRLDVLDLSDPYKTRQLSYSLDKEKGLWFGKRVGEGKYYQAYHPRGEETRGQLKNDPLRDPSTPASHWVRSDVDRVLSVNDFVGLIGQGVYNKIFNDQDTIRAIYGDSVGRNELESIPSLLTNSDPTRPFSIVRTKVTTAEGGEYYSYQLGDNFSAEPFLIEFVLPGTEQKIFRIIDFVDQNRPKVNFSRLAIVIGEGDEADVQFPMKFEPAYSDKRDSLGQNELVRSADGLFQVVKSQLRVKKNKLDQVEYDDKLKTYLFPPLEDPTGRVQKLENKPIEGSRDNGQFVGLYNLFPGRRAAKDSTFSHVFHWRGIWDAHYPVPTPAPVSQVMEWVENYVDNINKLNQIASAIGYGVSESSRRSPTPAERFWGILLGEKSSLAKMAGFREQKRLLLEELKNRLSQDSSSLQTLQQLLVQGDFWSLARHTGFFWVTRREMMEGTKGVKVTEDLRNRIMESFDPHPTVNFKEGETLPQWISRVVPSPDSNGNETEESLKARFLVIRALSMAGVGIKVGEVVGHPDLHPEQLRNLIGLVQTEDQERMKRYVRKWWYDNAEALTSQGETLKKEVEGFRGENAEPDANAILAYMAYLSQKGLAFNGDSNLADLLDGIIREGFNPNTRLSFDDWAEKAGLKGDRLKDIKAELEKGGFTTKDLQLELSVKRTSSGDMWKEVRIANHPLAPLVYFERGPDRRLNVQFDANGPLRTLLLTEDWQIKAVSYTEFHKLKDILTLLAKGSVRLQNLRNLLGYYRELTKHELTDDLSIGLDTVVPVAVVQPYVPEGNYVVQPKEGETAGGQFDYRDKIPGYLQYSILLPGDPAGRELARVNTQRGNAYIEFPLWDAFPGQRMNDSSVPRDGLASGTRQIGLEDPRQDVVLNFVGEESLSSIPPGYPELEAYRGSRVVKYEIARKGDSLDTRKYMFFTPDGRLLAVDNEYTTTKPFLNWLGVPDSKATFVTARLFYNPEKSFILPLAVMLTNPEGQPYMINKKTHRPPSQGDPAEDIEVIVAKRVMNFTMNPQREFSSWIESFTRATLNWMSGEGWKWAAYNDELARVESNDLEPLSFFTKHIKITVYRNQVVVDQVRPDLAESFMPSWEGIKPFLTYAGGVWVFFFLGGKFFQLISHVGRRVWLAKVQQRLRGWFRAAVSLPVLGGAITQMARLLTRTFPGQFPELASGPEEATSPTPEAQVMLQWIERSRLYGFQKRALRRAVESGFQNLSPLPETPSEQEVAPRAREMEFRLEDVKLLLDSMESEKMRWLRQRQFDRAVLGAFNVNPPEGHNYARILNGLNRIDLGFQPGLRTQTTQKLLNALSSLESRGVSLGDYYREHFQFHHSAFNRLIEGDRAPPNFDLLSQHPQVMVFHLYLWWMVYGEAANFRSIPPMTSFYFEEALARISPRVWEQIDPTYPPLVPNTGARFNSLPAETQRPSITPLQDVELGDWLRIQFKQWHEVMEENNRNRVGTAYDNFLSYDDLWELFQSSEFIQQVRTVYENGHQPVAIAKDGSWKTFVERTRPLRVGKFTISRKFMGIFTMLRNHFWYLGIFAILAVGVTSAVWGLDPLGGLTVEIFRGLGWDSLAQPLFPGVFKADLSWPLAMFFMTLASTVAWRLVGWGVWHFLDWADKVLRNTHPIATRAPRIGTIPRQGSLAENLRSRFSQFRGNIFQTLFQFGLFAVALGIVFYFDVFLFDLLVDPSFILSQSTWTPIPFVEFRNMLVVLLFSLFVMFTVLNPTSSFQVIQSVLSWFRGKFLGVGSVRTWSDLQALETPAKNQFYRHFLRAAEQNLGKPLTESEIDVAWAKTINAILPHLRIKHHLSPAEVQRLSFVIDGSTAGNRLSGTVRSNTGIFSQEPPANQEAQRRLMEFVEAMLMDSDSTPVWSRILSRTIVTPVYGEDILFPWEDGGEDPSLNVPLNTGETMLSEAIRLDPDEWNNFVAEMRSHPNDYLPGDIEDLERYQGGGVFAFTWQEQLGIQAMAKREALIMQIRIWGSLRYQPLARTAYGLREQFRAMEWIYQLQHPSATEEEARQATREKLQMLCSFQTYFDLAPDHHKVRAFNTLLRLVPEMEASVLVELKDGSGKNRVLINALQKGGYWRGDGFYQVLIRSQTNEQQGGLPYELINALHLPGTPVKGMGEGKPEHQSFLVAFARGDTIQAMDINQDDYFEAALNIPRAMAQMRRQKAMGVSFPEHIFTSRYRNEAAGRFSIGDKAATADVKRVANLLGVVGHWGHPDIMDAFIIHTLGGLSLKNYTNEDIFRAMLGWLYGKQLIHLEVYKPGKARDTGVMTIAGFQEKLGAGAFQQGISREIWYLVNRLGWLRMGWHFMGGPGFFNLQSLVRLTIYIYLFSILIGVMGFVEIPGETLFGILGVAISQSAGYLGILYMISRMGFMGFLQWAWQFPKMVIFWQNQIHSVAYGAYKAMQANTSWVNTGRRPMLDHDSPAHLFVYYWKTHLLPGLILMSIGLMGILLWNNLTLVLSALTLVFGFSSFISPFLFNPESTFSHASGATTREKLRTWWTWMLRDLGWRRGHGLEMNPDGAEWAHEFAPGKTEPLKKANPRWTLATPRGLTWTGLIHSLWEIPLEYYGTSEIWNESSNNPGQYQRTRQAFRDMQSALNTGHPLRGLWRMAVWFTQLVGLNWRMILLVSTQSPSATLKDRRDELALRYMALTNRNLNPARATFLVLFLLRVKFTGEALMGMIFSVGSLILISGVQLAFAFLGDQWGHLVARLGRQLRQTVPEVLIFDAGLWMVRSLVRVSTAWARSINWFSLLLIGALPQNPVVLRLGRQLRQTVPEVLIFDAGLWMVRSLVRVSTAWARSINWFSLLLIGALPQNPVVARLGQLYNHPIPARIRGWGMAFLFLSVLYLTFRVFIMPLADGEVASLFVLVFFQSDKIFLWLANLTLTIMPLVGVFFLAVKFSHPRRWRWAGTGLLFLGGALSMASFGPPEVNFLQIVISLLTLSLGLLGWAFVFWGGFKWVRRWLSTRPAGERAPPAWGFIQRLANRLGRVTESIGRIPSVVQFRKLSLGEGSGPRAFSRGWKALLQIVGDRFNTMERAFFSTLRLVVLPILLALLVLSTGAAQSHFTAGGWEWAIWAAENLARGATVPGQVLSMAFTVGRDAVILNTLFTFWMLLGFIGTLFYSFRDLRKSFEDPRYRLLNSGNNQGREFGSAFFMLTMPIFYSLRLLVGTDPLQMVTPFWILAIGTFGIVVGYIAGTGSYVLSLVLGYPRLFVLHRLGWVRVLDEHFEPGDLLNKEPHIRLAAADWFSGSSGSAMSDSVLAKWNISPRDVLAAFDKHIVSLEADLSSQDAYDEHARMSSSREAFSQRVRSYLIEDDFIKVLPQNVSGYMPAARWFVNGHVNGNKNDLLTAFEQKKQAVAASSLGPKDKEDTQKELDKLIREVQRTDHSVPPLTDLTAIPSAVNRRPTLEEEREYIAKLESEGLAYAFLLGEPIAIGLPQLLDNFSESVRSLAFSHHVDPSWLAKKITVILAVDGQDKNVYTQALKTWGNSLGLSVKLVTADSSQEGDLWLALARNRDVNNENGSSAENGTPQGQNGESRHSVMIDLIQSGVKDVVVIPSVTQGLNRETDPLRIPQWQRSRQMRDNRYAELVVEVRPDAVENDLRDHISIKRDGSYLFSPESKVLRNEKTKQSIQGYAGLSQAYFLSAHVLSQLTERKFGRTMTRDGKIGSDLSWTLRTLAVKRNLPTPQSEVIPQLQKKLDDLRATILDTRSRVTSETTSSLLGQYLLAQTLASGSEGSPQPERVARGLIHSLAMRKSFFNPFNLWFQMRSLPRALAKIHPERGVVMSANPSMDTVQVFRVPAFASKEYLEDILKRVQSLSLMRATPSAYPPKHIVIEFEGALRETHRSWVFRLESISGKSTRSPAILGRVFSREIQPGSPTDLSSVFGAMGYRNAEQVRSRGIRQVFLEGLPGDPLAVTSGEWAERLMSTLSVQRFLWAMPGQVLRVSSDVALQISRLVHQLLQA